MNLNHDLAREIVRQRGTTSLGSTAPVARRPGHPRAARALRRLAERIERET